MPLLFVTQTKEFTQSVGSMNSAIIPCLLSKSGSFLRGSHGALGTQCGGCIIGRTVESKVITVKFSRETPSSLEAVLILQRSDFASTFSCRLGVGAALVCVVAIP